MRSANKGAGVGSNGDRLDYPELLSISDAEAATGVSREVLRMWERRYGFPKPDRDGNGDRRYTADQVEKLRLIRLLQSCGYRAGELVDLGKPELEGMLMAQAPHHDETADYRDELIGVLKSPDIGRVRDFLVQQITRNGLYEFVTKFMPYANFIVGDEWQKGRLEIHEEHLYTEQVQAALSVAMNKLLPPLPDAPKVMVCTAPGEPHTLGILMVEALLRLERVNITSFGPEMPVKVIAQAVQKHGIDVVALSFSASYASARMAEFLELLRLRLPSRVRILAGGAAVQLSRRHVEGVEFMNGLESLLSLTTDMTLRKPAKPYAVRH